MTEKWSGRGNGRKVAWTGLWKKNGLDWVTTEMWPGRDNDRKVAWTDK